ncbi:MAG TPA: hypothetical protein VE978_26390 [Chitinophagales bacterium]|nr:hypothetical protein [Chitinophagales bacterium]
MKPIEERLWEFIDGTCSAGEKISIEKLLQADPAVKLLYEEFLSLSGNLKAMELDEPSMRFTQNVMDRIALELAPKPLITKIDKRIINIIAGFFIVTLSSLVIFTLTQLKWTSGDQNFSFSMPQVNWSILSGSAVVQGSLIAFVIIGLFALDRLLQHRRRMRAPL